MSDAKKFPSSLTKKGDSESVPSLRERWGERIEGRRERKKWIFIESLPCVLETSTDFL